MQTKWLVLAGTVTLVVLTLFLLVSTNQVLNTAASSNTVSFSGEGKVTAKPDVAQIDFAIVTEAATSKAAQDANSAKSKTVTDFLKTKNIDEKDVKTSGYNIYPQYSYSQPSRPKIIGYQVSQNLQVKVRNLDTVNEVLDGVVNSGVNQVNGLTFTIDNMEKLKEEARQKAVEDAKVKAKALERQIGVNLGKIINFSENVGGFPPPIYYASDKLMNEAVGRGGGPSLPTGENEVMVTVQLTYQIK